MSSVLVGFCFNKPTCDAAIVFAPDLEIPQGTGMLEVPIRIEANEAEMFQNVTIAFGLGDGGPRLGGTNNVAITGVRYQGETIFDGETVISFEAFSFPAVGAQIASVSVDRPDFDLRIFETDAASTLMIFNVDVSSMRVGDTLDLNVNAGDRTNILRSDGSVVPLTFRSSQIRITAVPEPSGLLAVALVAFVALHRRRHVRPVRPSLRIFLMKRFA